MVRRGLRPPREASGKASLALVRGPSSWWGPAGQRSEPAGAGESRPGLFT